MDNFKRIVNKKFIGEVIGEVIYRKSSLIFITFCIIIFNVFFTFTMNPTLSMYPAIDKGSSIFGLRVYKNIERSDIILFKDPTGAIIYPFSKRVLGLPGEVVEIRDRTIYINNEKYVDPHLFDVEFSDDLIVTLDRDEYFVIGDNRADSFDSRDFGPIKEKSIRSKVIYVFNLGKILNLNRPPKDFR